MRYPALRSVTAPDGTLIGAATTCPNVKQPCGVSLIMQCDRCQRPRCPEFVLATAVPPRQGIYDVEYESEDE